VRESRVRGSDDEEATENLRESRMPAVQNFEANTTRKYMQLPTVSIHRGLFPLRHNDRERAAPCEAPSFGSPDNCTS